MERRRVVVPAVAASLVAVAVLVWLRARDGDEAGGPGEVVTVAPRAFAATVAAIGAVKPQIGAEVRVGSRISGRVRRLRANIGDRIAKGQVIAELETAELDAVTAQRRAELKLAEAKLAAFETLSPEEVARAEADVARFEATAKLAAEHWERQQTLFRERVATRAEADAAREQHMVAQAQLESARRDLELVRTGSAELRKQAEADHERARAALQSALVDRSFTVLTSPISGIIASVSTQEGETVAAGLSAPTFVTIVDLDRLQVDAFVDEVDIGKVKAGQPAVFTVDAFPARDFTGRVRAIYPTATIQDNVVKYVVVIDIADEYGGLLRPEMTASVRIELEPRKVLAVPTAAIRRQDGRSVVYVLNDGRAAVRNVRVGWRDGPWVEIVEGLVAGERVLLDAPATGGEEAR
ncbi:MAG: efflux RND transporter periplasmic adaptor subunit [Gemmatimonadetes bacterium]|nr:efflux RND transporter periplasmic adaptor subunit [Gemmatimonadota bacterium]